MTMISVVTSLWRSAPYIKDFHARHLAGLEKLGVDYEFIFVNDGSPDDSAARVMELIKTHPHVTLLDLSRNFGQHAAMFAGLGHAKGDYVYATDCDLEEDPENITALYEKIVGDPEIDVVYGVLRTRTGGPVRRLFGKLFYVVLDVLSEVKVPRDQAWQRIMTRAYVEALLRYNEVESLPAGLMVLAGFNQVPMLIEKRYKGSTTYTFGKRLALALNAITAFSSKPLTIIGVSGLCISCLAFLLLVVVVIQKLFFLNIQTGWTTVVGSIWLVGGLILSSLGVMGTYLGKMFNQMKNRPLYIVRSVKTSAIEAAPEPAACTPSSAGSGG